MCGLGSAQVWSRPAGGAAPSFSQRRRPASRLRFEVGEGPRPTYLHLRGVDPSKQPWGGPWPCQRGQAHDPYLVPHSGGAEAAGLRLQEAAVKDTVDRSYDIAFGTHCSTRLRPPGLGTTRISIRPPRASDERGPGARRDVALAGCAAQASPSVGQDLYPPPCQAPGRALPGNTRIPQAEVSFGGFTQTLERRGKGRLAGPCDHPSSV